MTRLAALVPPSSPHWAAVRRRVPHDVYHDPGYLALDADYTGGRAVAFVYREAEHALLLPLVLQPIPGSDRLDAASPYGYPAPVSDTQDERFWDRAVEALIDALAAEGVVSAFVRLHPLLAARHSALARRGTLIHHGDTVAIDLRRSEEELWRQIRGHHRRHIHRARRLGRRTVIDDWQLLDDFVDIYHETMRRVGATPYYFFPSSYVTALRAALGERLHLAVVLADSTPAGAGLFVEDGGVVQYHLGGSRTSYLDEQPARLFIDEVRRWASVRGNTMLHLGPGAGARSDALYYFKAGFSDVRHPFHTWQLVVDEAEYERLAPQREQRAVPAAGGGFFPAYRAAV
jgi:hypothetical protein